MRLLLVEDDSALAEVTRRGLVEEGHVVQVEVEGISGLMAACEPGFDVVILDIMLPGMNGYDVLKNMRARKVWTPVIMLTAKDGEYDQEDAFDLGADDYVTKPFSFVVLNARIRALSRRGRRPRPTVLSAENLTLDPASHRVVRFAEEVELTPREFNLLEFLIRHKGEAVTKSQILESVWDSMYEGDPNVVEVYVGYLRRKLDAPFGAASIETVRGVGYRLRPDLTA
jgi:two-component system, OmpR family, response regulator